MKDSEAPQGPHESTDKADPALDGASNGHQPDFGEAGSLAPAWPEFETLLEMKQRLLDLQADEARLRRLNAGADVAEAKAEEARHQAIAEPKRQQMTLRERTTALLLESLKYVLAALLTLAIIALQVVGFLINPWYLSLNLLIACLGLWARRFTAGDKEKQGPPPHSEGDP
jgi:hypothetical protein